MVTTELLGFKIVDYDSFFFSFRSEENTFILKSSVANLDLTYIMSRDLPILLIWVHRKFTS